VWDVEGLATSYVEVDHEPAPQGLEVVLKARNVVICACAQGQGAKMAMDGVRFRSRTARPAMTACTGNRHGAGARQESPIEDDVQIPIEKVSPQSEERG
jgi:hypothetical protein